MALVNPWFFIKNLFDAETFLANTGNKFRFLFGKPYQSKKHPDEVGATLTLQILYDRTDYGTDKNGQKRGSNLMNTFDVTILNGKTEIPFKSGDIVSLVDFIPEKSYVIGFDLLLRFKDVKKAGGSDGQN
ncbi:MAG: hypothetical protein NC321_05855 [Clostridium sp.]|nr:hypothetical protein [Clostridium sp.]